VYINNQATEYSCAAVAVYNTLIWLGRKIPYEEIEKQFEKFKTYKKHKGSTLREMEKILSKYDICYNPLPDINLEDLDKFMKAGYSVILATNYLGDDDFVGGHVQFLIKSYKNYFKGFNIEGDGSKTKFQKLSFEKYELLIKLSQIHRSLNPKIQEFDRRLPLAYLIIPD